jgi:hypothetical protein
MSARRPFRLLIICIVVLLSLTGCVFTLSPVKPLLTPGSAHAREVAVAVEANGIKHYAWTECATSGPSTTCQLVYERRNVNRVIAQGVFTFALGADLRNPDVAATADGRAFMVHTVCSPSACTDYYSVIPADAIGSTPIAPAELALPAANSAGVPRLKARDNVVYAVYLVAGESNTRLRYRQLSGGTSGGYADYRNSGNNSNPSIAIGSNGVLHAVWKTYTASSTEINYGHNTGSTEDFGGVNGYDFAGNHAFSNPDIALDGNNTPYMVYSYYSGGGDIVKIQCQATASLCYNGVTTQIVPLDAAQHPWRLRGSPHIQVPGSAPTIVFSASNSVTGNNEIWHYTPPSSGTDPGPTRVTTNDVQDDEPLIVEEHSNFGDIEVVAWRTYITLTPPPTPPLPPIPYECMRDGYSFYFNNTTVRRVFESTGGCHNYSQDLAASGQWVAAAWIDRLVNSDDTRIVPWTTFNAHTTYTPITGK